MGKVINYVVISCPLAHGTAIHQTRLLLLLLAALGWLASCGAPLSSSPPTTSLPLRSPCSRPSSARRSSLPFDLGAPIDLLSSARRDDDMRSADQRAAERHAGLTSQLSATRSSSSSAGTAGSAAAARAAPSASPSTALAASTRSTTATPSTSRHQQQQPFALSTHPRSRRGRKQDDTLPPSVSLAACHTRAYTDPHAFQRSRDVQRAFRARRAEYLANLEDRVRALELENSELREQLSQFVGGTSGAGGAGGASAGRDHAQHALSPESFDMAATNSSGATTSSSQPERHSDQVASPPPPLTTTSSRASTSSGARASGLPDTSGPWHDANTVAVSGSPHWGAIAANPLASPDLGDGGGGGGEQHAFAGSHFGDSSAHPDQAAFMYPRPDDATASLMSSLAGVAPDRSATSAAYRLDDLKLDPSTTRTATPHFAQYPTATMSQQSSWPHARQSSQDRQPGSRAGTGSSASSHQAVAPAHPPQPQFSPATISSPFMYALGDTPQPPSHQQHPSSSRRFMQAPTAYESSSPAMLATSHGIMSASSAAAASTSAAMPQDSAMAWHQRQQRLFNVFYAELAQYCHAVGKPDISAVAPAAVAGGRHAPVADAWTALATAVQDEHGAISLARALIDESEQRRPAGTLDDDMGLLQHPAQGLAIPVRALAKMQKLFMGDR